MIIFINISYTLPQLEKSLGVTNGSGLALDKDRNSGVSTSLSRPPTILTANSLESYCNPDLPRLLPGVPGHGGEQRPQADQGAQRGEEEEREEEGVYHGRASRD